MDVNAESNGAVNEEEEVPYIDPVTLKPDLYAAAVANKTEDVVNLLGQGVPGTFIDTSTGWTPLHWAAMHGNAPMMRALLAHGASEPYHRLVNKAKRAKDEHPSLGHSSSMSEIKQAMDKGEEDDGGLDEVKFETQSPHDREPGQEDITKAIEVSVDLTKNTPLLWATHKGKLAVIWYLLDDGYSPNDVDKMDNNALHLAAAHGDLKILKVLIDDGVTSNVVNHYKNHAIDMAKTKEVRDMIAAAMVAGASMTEKDIVEKHEKNMRQYKRMVKNLEDAIEQALKVDDPSYLKSISASESSSMMNALSEVIAVGKEWSLEQEKIHEAERLLLKLEIAQELMSDMEAVKKVMPISSQRVYIDTVYKLEKSIEKAKNAGIDKSQLDIGLDLIAKCQIEYWLAVLLERLKDVVTADDSNEHDMIKLNDAVKKAESLKANEDLITRGSIFMRRLEAELAMSRAIKYIPTYKLPPHDGVIVEGYWGERDMGKVKETEGFPLPPESGEYEWIPSESFSALGRAIVQLKSAYDGAEQLRANPAIIAETKEKIIRCEKDYKILEAKDNADKAAAIEAVKKMAKKLKGGKKKAKN